MYQRGNFLPCCFTAMTLLHLKHFGLLPSVCILSYVIACHAFHRILLIPQLHLKGLAILRKQGLLPRILLVALCKSCVASWPI